MKFAKLYDTCEKHQILVYIIKEEDKWGLAFETWVDDLGLVHSHFAFDSIKDCAQAFADTDEQVAGMIVADTLKELKEQAVRH
jgi:hypothetical protein